jgi:hydrogenase small subunit
MALPRTAAGQIAKALNSAKKPVLVWLEFQDCTGDTESFLRATGPTTAEVILDTLSVDYHETIMAPSGHQAHKSLQDVLKNHSGEFIAVVEGSIPTGADGAYCVIGGRSSVEIAKEVCGKAAATVAVGTCAAFGGLPAAKPNPTNALSVAEAVPGIKNLINLPACPANAENIVALITHYLTFKRWPALDGFRRPLFAHAKAIHDNCERRAHFDAGQFAESFGDEAHRAGQCLYKLGCKGPVAFHNCPTVRWNEGTSWPVGCGHPCVGCSEAGFWDTMTPFYAHLPGVPLVPRVIGENLDRAGAVLVGGAAAAFTGHGLVMLGRRTLFKKLAFKGDPADEETKKHASKPPEKPAERGGNP